MDFPVWCTSGYHDPFRSSKRCTQYSNQQRLVQHVEEERMSSREGGEVHGSPVFLCIGVHGRKEQVYDECPHEYDPEPWEERKVIER